MEVQWPLVKGAADGPNGGVGLVAPFYFYTAALPTFLGEPITAAGMLPRTVQISRGKIEEDPRMSVAPSHNHYTPTTTLYIQLPVCNFVQYTPQYLYSHTEHRLDGLVRLMYLVLIAPIVYAPEPN